MKLPLNVKRNYKGKTYLGGDEIPDELAKEVGLMKNVSVDWTDDIVPKEEGKNKKHKKDGE